VVFASFPGSATILKSILCSVKFRNFIFMKQKIIRVGVLMGGPSAEHDVSLATGLNVMDNLDRKRYQPVSIKITQDKEWLIGGRKTTEAKALESCDVIFNALHGTFGEDGRIQALLEYFDKPYTGSGMISSALAMDKLRSREIFKTAELTVPKTLKIRKGENYQAVLNVFVNKVAGFPVVVKPCSNGSSFGISIVANQSQMKKAIDSAFKIEKKVLIEEFIKGKEVTCGVLESADRRIVALPITEIIPKKGRKFFDFHAKYKRGFSDEITPARLDEETTKRVQEIAEKSHRVLGCRTYSRTDMIIRDGEIYVLEINTLPGLTNNSLLPKAASVAGLTLGKLIDNIISSTLA